MKKNEKKPGDIIILNTCAKNYDDMMYGSWDTVRDGQTDGRMDEWKKWHKEMGVPPNNCYNSYL